MKDCKILINLVIVKTKVMETVKNREKYQKLKL